MRRKEPMEVMDEIDAMIWEGLDVDGLRKVRRRLYRLDDEGLSIEEFYRKGWMLLCIKEILEDER